MKTAFYRAEFVGPALAAGRRAAHRITATAADKRRPYMPNA